jgi:hypothetical protein
MHVGNDKVYVENLTGRHQFEDLLMEDGIILKCMLRRSNVLGQNEARIRSSIGNFERDNEYLGSINGWEFLHNVTTRFSRRALMQCTCRILENCTIV